VKWRYCQEHGRFCADGGRLIVVSLYGIWDLVAGTQDKYVETTLHRAICDLSVVFQEPGTDLILSQATSTSTPTASVTRSWTAA
jgi:hypothetical protein